MHDSMRRLHEVSGKHKKRDIAKDLNVSPSTVTNWSARGVSKEGAIAAAKFYTSNANYILDGGANNESASSQDNPLVSSDMPLFKLVSAGSYNKHFDNTNILGYIARPKNLSKESFALIVAGRSMMPEFKASDYVCVEVDVVVQDLQDGDFVVVQHKEADYAVIKQIMIGGSVGDIYLTQLNKDMPDFNIISIGDYLLIGVIDSKITKYRDSFHATNERQC